MVMVWLLLGAFNVFGSEKNIYIDPQNLSDPRRDGSINHPFASWSEIEPASNTAYYIKRASVLRLKRPLNIHHKINVTVGSYGKGKLPVILSDKLEKPVNISNSSRILIKDLYIDGNNTSSFCLRIIGKSRDVTLKDAQLYNAQWGIRIIGFEGNNRPKGIKITRVSVKNTGDDGIFVQRASGLMIDSCRIEEVNQKWFTHGKNELLSRGDGIQLVNCQKFIIQNCRIDRSDTGNKFCLIISQSKLGQIINNKMAGPMKTGSGACIYLGYKSDSLTLKHNILSNSDCGVYSHARHLLLFKNTIKENQTGAIFLNTTKAVIINNTFWNNPVALRGTKLEMYNNIFYSGKVNGSMLYLKEPIRLSHNCYFIKPNDNPLVKKGRIYNSIPANHQRNHSIFSDPLIRQSSTGELTLSEHSPCIDKGRDYHRRYNIENPFCGQTIDIGASEYCPSHNGDNKGANGN
jgi:hypothetical protein